MKKRERDIISKILKVEEYSDIESETTKKPIKGNVLETDYDDDANNVYNIDLIFRGEWTHARGRSSWISDSGI